MSEINKQEIDTFILESEKISSIVKRGIKHEIVENSELYNMLSKEEYSALLNKVSSEEQFKENSQLIENAYNKRNTENLIKKLNERKNQNSIKRVKLTTISIAVSIVVAVFFSYSVKVTDENIISNSIVEQKIKVPTIITDNDVEIEIKSENKKISINEIEKILISRSADNPAVKKVEQRRIVIPNGYTYSIVLSDKTTVILNGGSELSFPTSFEGDVRRVALKGEAYFEVEKSSKPFLVDINDAYVKVYGTIFSVSGYKKNKVEVVLLEGSVGVGNEYISEIKIVPNQMAVIDNLDNKCEVTTIDPCNFTGWIDGYFRYVNADFSELIQDLSLWYNVNLEYNMNDFVNNEINLSISRSLSLEEMLNVIENILNIKFIREGENKYVIEK